MSYEAIISDSSHILNMILLFADISKILKDLAKSISEASIDASLLLMAWNEDLIQLNEKVFVAFFVSCHLFSQLHVQVLLETKECKSFSYYSEVTEDAVSWGKILRFWVSEVSESLCVDGESREMLAHVGKDIVLDKCADCSLLLLWHVHVIEWLPGSNDELIEARLLISKSMNIHYSQCISYHCLYLLISV